MSRMRSGGGVAVFFFLSGLGLVVVSQLDSVTGVLDANSTPDSDPAGGVLLMIGAIWAAVGAVLLAGFTLVGRSSSRGTIARQDELDAAREAQAVAAHAAPATKPGGPAADTLDRLEKLQGLREKGVLTEAEFAVQKAKILSRS